MTGRKDTYTIKEDDLGSYEGVYSKYPYDINLVIEKKYEDYTAGVDKAILTINNETREINISNITEQKITVTDDNGENLDVTMNASKENDEITITLIIEDRISVIDEESALPEVCSDTAKLLELHKEHVALSEELDTLYERWEELSEELNNIK